MIVDRKDLEVLSVAGAHLHEMGFSFRETYELAAQEISLPVIGFQGMLGDIDIGRVCGRVGILTKRTRETALEIYAGYITRAMKVGEKPTGRGRFTKLYWGADQSNTVRRLSTVFAAPCQGYYGVPTGQVALTYHAAEVAYYLSKAVPDVTLSESETHFLAEVEGEQIGAVDDVVLMPGGEVINTDFGFELSKFKGVERRPPSSVPGDLRVWAQVSNFIDARPTPPALRQALAHCRWYYGGRVTWADGRFLNEGLPVSAGKQRNGRKLASLITPLHEKLNIVENAVELAKNPYIPSSTFKGMLVPAVLSYTDYYLRFGGAHNKTIGKNINQRRLQRLRSNLDTLHAELSYLWSQENGS